MGCRMLAPLIVFFFPFLESETIGSNFVAYLTNNTKNDEGMRHRYAIYFLLILTTLNISVTFIWIHIYLKIKHSKAINIAERTQWSMKVTLISLRHLAGVFYCVLMIGVVNFCVYHTNSYQDLNSVPPVNILVNVVCVLTSLHFVFNKKEIMDFLKRRTVIPLQDIPFVPNRPSHKNSSPKNRDKRTIAWN